MERPAAPTPSQAAALAFAPAPFALLSLLASLRVLRHARPLLRSGPRRMYRRLVFAMNLALVLLAVVDFWGTMAVPADTPGYVGAFGTVGTCTAQGFLNLVCAMTVPIYYGSLSWQALLSLRNNFKEGRYASVEKYIHLFAWCVPISLAMVVAATENINPAGSGCWIAKSPPGCEADPLVECTRGDDIRSFVLVFGLGQICLYFVFPPMVVGYIYCWLRKRKVRAEDGESTKRRMMRDAAVQIAVYLLAFWSTFVFGLIYNVYYMLTKRSPYNFLIFANCVFAAQGAVFAAVYFELEKIGRAPHAQCVADGRRQSRALELQRRRRGRGDSSTGDDSHDPPTLEDAGPGDDMYHAGDSNNDGSWREGRFNIFCGHPEDSPWAEFFDASDEEEMPPLPPQLAWEPAEGGDAGRGLDMRTKLYLCENVLGL